jgi:hypothetical protein
MKKLKEAARWYGELFAMTTDLEPVYYYRYAQSLRFHWWKWKSDEMMDIRWNVEKNTDKKKIKSQPTILLKQLLWKITYSYITIISVFLNIYSQKPE